MCTSISYRRQDHYFGRTLDVEFSFREQVVITPRNYRIHMENCRDFRTGYALIGVASVMNGCPMYYEAANEAGLAMAGLNFPRSAHYEPPKADRDNLALFELIPWVLGQAKTVDEAKKLLARVNLVPFYMNGQNMTPPLHFMISDKERSIVVEPMEDGLHIHENPYDVMTNEPPFEYHLWNMRNYRHLSPANGEQAAFTDRYPLEDYAVGMGALGLPGDCSSTSRFVRAAFHLANSRCADNEVDNVSQFFHILDSVSMVKGAVLTNDGKDDLTLYSCCINVDKGIFYYKTYGNSQISAVKLRGVDLNGEHLSCYSLHREQNICYDN